MTSLTDAEIDELLSDAPSFDRDLEHLKYLHDLSNSIAVQYQDRIQSLKNGPKDEMRMKHLLIEHACWREKADSLKVIIKSWE